MGTYNNFFILPWLWRRFMRKLPLKYFITILIIFTTINVVAFYMITLKMAKNNFQQFMYQDNSIPQQNYPTPTNDNRDYYLLIHRSLKDNAQHISNIHEIPKIYPAINKRKSYNKLIKYPRDEIQYKYSYQ